MRPGRKLGGACRISRKELELRHHLTLKLCEICPRPDLLVPGLSFGHESARFVEAALEGEQRRASAYPQDANGCG